MSKFQNDLQEIESILYGSLKVQSAYLKIKTMQFKLLDYQVFSGTNIQLENAANFIELWHHSATEIEMFTALETLKTILKSRVTNFYEIPEVRFFLRFFQTNNKRNLMLAERLA